MVHLLGEGRARLQVERLEQLGVLVCEDVDIETDESGVPESVGGRASLTPAGVAVAVRLLEAEGVEIVPRPDPATITASDLVVLAEQTPPEAWLEDAASWVAARGESAAVDLGDALADGDREPLAVLAVVMHVDAVLGDQLDTEGSEAVVAGVSDGRSAGAVVETLDRLWRLEHERVGEVLEAVGRHHPDKAVAKHSRKVLAKYRSRDGGRGPRR